MTPAEQIALFVVLAIGIAAITTAIAVGLDAAKHDWTHTRGWSGGWGPVAWALVAWALWPFGLAWYFVARRKAPLKADQDEPVAEPGFYPDPLGATPQRYWDGHRWTNDTQQGLRP